MAEWQILAALIPTREGFPPDPLTLEASISRAALGSREAPEWGRVFRGR